MYVKRLELDNFRNYKRQSIVFGDGINILYGENAQGKTNILEALYLTATGKSQRTNNYHDLIMNGTDGFEVRMDAVSNDSLKRIGIRYTKDKGRYAEVNGIRRNRISDILGTMNMIFFSPETLDIIKGSPQCRRKFIDVLLCQVSKSYLHSLQQYNQIIKNKSAALKKGRNDKKYDEVIPVWNEHLAGHGGRICYIRDKTIRRLDDYMKREIEKITSGGESSELAYKTFTGCPDMPDEAYYREQLRLKLEQGRARERELGQCLYGPHRDDIEISLNCMNSRQYCSQGQQRSLALSLVIGELKLVEEIRGEKPVLLLDDVMSELDQKRQEYLLKGLYDIQTIITTTDVEQLKSGLRREVTCMRVVSGNVCPD